jgi:membrane associated rhomboid family serine protease
MKHYKLIWFVIAINAICFFIPHEYFKYLTVQSNEHEAINTLIQSFTYMFMSENWLHILFNTIFLFAFREIIYLVIPDILFVAYYIIWGVLVGILNYLIAHNFSYSYLIGNSGVLYAFMGYLILFVGNTKLELLNGLKISLFNFGVVLISICIIQITMNNNVYGNIAHINGFILGLITAKIYKTIKLWQHN